MITVERLKESFKYNPDTGEFIRVKSGNKPIGHISGVLDASTGYIKIGVGNKVLHAHRLAWLYMTGKYPDKQIDHINGIRHDNRWCNLREVNQCLQNKNLAKRIDNTTGVTGVVFTDGKYWARIYTNKTYINLGRFSTLEEAASVRKEAEIKYGFSKRHGS